MADELIRLDTTIIGIDSLINKASTAEEAKALFTVKDVIYSQQRYFTDVQPVDRWISCKDRLPEDNTIVLYVWRSENGNVSVFHGWHSSIRGLGSAWHQSGVGMQRPDDEVTHWMPLPEPPKDGENT